MRILLHGVSDSEQEGFVQRIAIYLLNSLACQVDGRQKLFLGDLGAIAVSFFFIQSSLKVGAMYRCCEISAICSLRIRLPLDVRLYGTADRESHFNK